MSQLPGKSGVDRALRNVVRETKAALKDLNKQAAKTMERGDYAKAESLVGAARELLKFQAEVETLRERWKGVSRSSIGEPVEPSDRTPLWSYYQPILRAIIAHG